jgi:transcriptional regulator GlxA family with amidase domain
MPTPAQRSEQTRAAKIADVFRPALNVAILVFDDVEVLDFAGPFEVFSRCRTQPGVESRRSNDGALFNVYCVARTRAPVAATGGLQIVPHCDFAGCPPVDVLVVPGGWGTRALLENRETLSWIERVAATATKVTSVCTGSLLLAKAGLLREKEATTHWGALDTLAELDATIHAKKKTIYRPRDHHLGGNFGRDRHGAICCPPVART